MPPRTHFHTSLYYILRVYISPLRLLPGPSIARLPDLWRFSDTLGGHCERTQLLEHPKYGHFIRTGLDFLSISGPKYYDITYPPGDEFCMISANEVSDTIKFLICRFNADIIL